MIMCVRKSPTAPLFVPPAGPPVIKAAAWTNICVRVTARPPSLCFFSPLAVVSSPQKQVALSTFRGAQGVPQGRRLV